MIEIPYSFKDILITLAVVLVIYYGYVILRYYRDELNDFLKGRRHSNVDQEMEDEVEVIDPFERFHTPVTQEPIAEENYQLAEELILRLKEIISNSSDQGFEEHQVMNSIREAVSEYPTLKDELLRGGIKQLILSEMSIHGFISPSPNEVDDLWKVRLG